MITVIDRHHGYAAYAALDIPAGPACLYFPSGTTVQQL